MASTPDRNRQHVVFDTSSFYEQAGFERGEILRPFFPDLPGGELRELLVDVLNAHVVPKLDQQVQTLQIPTVHNPLRVTSVDGEAVTWNKTERGIGPSISPATVRVSIPDIDAVARKRRIVVPE